MCGFVIYGVLMRSVVMCGFVMWDVVMWGVAMCSGLGKLEP